MPQLDLTDQQARDVIRALSVHARDLASIPRAQNPNKAEIKRLDGLRKELEALLDSD
jgi:hypothetical protein